MIHNWPIELEKVVVLIYDTRHPGRQDVTVTAAERNITLRYIGYDENALCCANGSPVWPRLKAGNVALFPLKPAIESKRWNLVAGEGENTVVPAIADEWRTPTTLESPRAFILHELANTLVRGEPADQKGAAYYLAGQREEPAELRPMLEVLLGGNDDKWLLRREKLQPRGRSGRVERGVTWI